ncbi:dTDP-4-dehydrorhamnose reductase [Candidatus Woesearchaeota archaeon]|nr:dTDP-4-dehydrorhamnose reductase [Candidatus Woesearchaeota archaeon]
MRVVVFGGYGQLGTDIVNELRSNKIDAIPLSHDDVDITDSAHVSRLIEEYSPDIIINSAALHKVDECESNPQKAKAVNMDSVENLAMICKEKDMILLHISTDYVFDGKSQEPYTEQDTPIPINVYGKTKLQGEQRIQEIGCKHFILRVASLYGNKASTQKKGNFVETMLKLAKTKDELSVVDDQYMTPTATLHIAKQIIPLIKTDEYGIYHCTCEGSCTWYEFAKEIFRLSDISIKVIPVDSSAYPANFERPRYTVLENSNLKKHRINIMPHWKEAIKQFISERRIIENKDKVEVET